MTAEPSQCEASQPEFESLYHRAFADYRVRALWNLSEIEHPTPAEALAITRSLRVEGDLSARSLAEQIERACRAAL
jgi:hypothetical protein